MNSCHATKSCVLILLMALLSAQRAQGLECYHCEGVPFEASCSSTRTCPYPDAFCVTQVGEVPVGSTTKKMKSQQCLSFCPIDTENKRKLAAPVNMKISCCKEDLCNAAVPTGGSTWTMAGMLLFSLGSVLLQTLL
ncbi:lymphocyte antigen 6A-2/6E-1-like [Arvicanthis niloticus]|uniref:lymphocyte antigen 6A-2/6E-1-like n=1 Tax=Arvicanthis niloticus TaxID=61156 RepID=UPI00148747B7|nr:lymphocyte antigen 6A-2/6E-1-like [Arvicanthis niloticus]XP_034372589.1 lymphocyte antigen 6A-2/6E-1-like [Arvicanthis niloticus]XP_034372590.1 lymphocyte antigen 6A-2/6E-1-like [Arvicanthis niloticus]XP_034372591.1 lymphocyte antigen 6A-2/6E-1-like [Arvicanthis niloticus]